MSVGIDEYIILFIVIETKSPGVNIINMIIHDR